MSKINKYSFIHGGAKENVESLLNKLFTDQKQDQELEISLYDYDVNKEKVTDISFEHYKNIISYIKRKSINEKKELKEETTEDIIYTDDKGTNYRIILDGSKNTNDINSKLSDLYTKNNHVIFKAILEKIGRENLIIKDTLQKIDIDELFSRCRLSAEKKVHKDQIRDIVKIIDYNVSQKIIFRYKQRISYVFFENEHHKMKIDVTLVKQNNNVDLVENSYPRYEIEIEIYKKSNNNKNDPKLLKIFYEEYYKLLKIIQKSSHIITKSEADIVMNKYCEILSLNKNKINMLEAMQSVSLEIQHVLDYVPNQTNLTDKPDGERSNLICANGECYIISNTLKIKKTNIKCDKEYNNTIADCEYVYIGKKRKHLCLLFDMLYYKNVDVRTEILLSKRLEILDDFIKNVLSNKEYKIHSSKIVKLQGDALATYYKKDILEYFSIMNHNLESVKNNFVFQKKYFMNPTGTQDNEIFKFAEIMWTTCTKMNVCPYKIDGLMFTPLEQKYTKDIRNILKWILKWKPDVNNSIDFYIEFVRNRETGEIMKLFDNSDDTSTKLKGKVYKIAHLYVGQMFKGHESYKLFMTSHKKNDAYLFTGDDSNVRDSEGNIIQDKTVVEFYYDAKSDIDDNYRWVPIKTRHDKTDSVKRFGRRYGNSKDTAEKIWRSITNPVSMDDFVALAKDGNFTEYSQIVKSRISQKIIAAERSKHYQRQIARPMNDFHNWIKSTLIFSYFSPKYDTNNKIVVLDIGVGKGLEIMKMFYARIDLMVGIDINPNSIYSEIDGAESRYKQMKETNRNFAPMYFVVADAANKLDLDNQLSIIPNMEDKNKILIRRFFDMDKENKKRYQRFNRVNVQMSISRFLENTTTWNNFIFNINKYMEPNGFMIITTLDGELVDKLFSEHNKYKVHYMDAESNKKLLFEFVKTYDSKSGEIYDVGNKFQYYNSTMHDINAYDNEYLVDRRFLVKELKSKCNLQLMETNTYDRLFNINKEYFDKYAQWEEFYKTRNFLLEAKKYYNQEADINKACFELTKLCRYYIFQKLPEDEDTYYTKYESYKSESDIIRKKIPHKSRFTKTDASLGNESKQERVLDKHNSDNKSSEDSSSEDEDSSSEDEDSSSEDEDSSDSD
jgi:hypothetical protein